MNDLSSVFAKFPRTHSAAAAAPIHPPQKARGSDRGGNHSNPPITIFLALQSSQEHSWALFRTVGGSRESLYKSESILWTRLILFVVVSDEEFSDKIDYIIWSYLLI